MHYLVVVDQADVCVPVGDQQLFHRCGHIHPPLLQAEPGLRINLHRARRDAVVQLGRAQGRRNTVNARGAPRGVGTHMLTPVRPGRHTDDQLLPEARTYGGLLLCATPKTGQAGPQETATPKTGQAGPAETDPTKMAPTRSSGM